ncbi:expressed unknown protein [Ectocarpus siliculosus]|uniref:Uncharacterized protein n=1 Tax=Ectocarpus siliculosus TaxID=2880 RepID=D8LJC7_ECTSI|nr:expressed unknown protein [Ectocarpus siliculosus]|eukprot:CBN79460.1 expressed unknown protein [Ectocarpus siliculosus]
MSVMGTMAGMGGGGGGQAPQQFRIRTRPPTGPDMMEVEDDRHPKMSSLHSASLPPCYPGELEEVRLARTEGLRECLSIVKECGEEAVKEAGTDCIRSVSDFIAGWRFRDGDGGGAKHVGESDLVPLAVVDAGLQLGDRRSAVQHMKEGLERGNGELGGRRRPQVVAVLRAQDCRTVEAAFKQILRQKCHARGGARSRRPLFMDALEEWYGSCAISSSTSTWEPSGEEEGGEDGTAVDGARAPGRRVAAAAAARRRQGPVVVLLEDVEGFDKQVLRDLLNVLAQPPCKSRRVQRKTGGTVNRLGGTVTRFGRTLPLALVAIASARVGFPMDRLSPSAVRQLSPENFYFPSSVECIDLLYEKLFVQRRLPVWMGGRLLSWMKTTFDDTHLSLGMFSRQVIMAAFLHFNRPASYLCLQHCRPWLWRSSLSNCPVEAMTHMKYKLARDSKSMPANTLQASLPGVPARLDPQQAAGLIEKGLRREASMALRVWFFHKVWSVLLKSLEGRETPVELLRMADAVLGRPGRQAGGTREGAGAGLDVGTMRQRAVKLGSSVRILGLLSASKKSRRYYAELKEVSEALAYLLPGEVKGLLRELLRALPSANQRAAAAAAATDPSAAADADADAESGAISATTGSDDASTDDRSPELSGSTSPERSAERSGNTSPEISLKTTSPGPSSERSPTKRREISGKKSSQERPPTISQERPAENSRDFSSSPTAPLVVQGLDRTEADYLRRGAERVLGQWGRAEQEGWAEPDDNTIEWGRSTSYLNTCATSGGTSGGGGGGGGGKSAGSRGNRLFSSRSRQPAGSENGGAPSNAEDNQDQREALNRACLVRELQLLFLHVMGEARAASLGPGMVPPPPLAEHTSVLAEAYCCDEKEKDAIESSLCPLARANVDLGMMEGACKGSSRVILQRRSMSEEIPVLDLCALYSCYRGHGKTIDRSDWFLDFRKEALKHKTRIPAAAKATAPSTGGKTKKKSSRSREISGGAGGGGVQTSSKGGGGVPDEEGAIDPTGGAELLARFEHASDQLASMGYVRPLKRRKRAEAEGGGGKGQAPGPKGSVTRLVFSYTMEDGAL